MTVDATVPSTSSSQSRRSLSVPLAYSRRQPISALNLPPTHKVDIVNLVTTNSSTGLAYHIVHPALPSRR